MMVKVCGITRRQDAEAAARAGADALGFIFYPPSPRYVTPDQAAKLGDGLAPLKVGVFVNETAASIEAVVRAAHLDVAQIYGGEIPHGVRVWKAYRVSGPLSPDAAKDAEAILLDGPSNGIPFDWTLALQPGQSWPGSSALPSRDREGFFPRFILAGGLNPANVQSAIRALHPWGVDASSGLETAPGIKDHAKVMQFVENARKAAL